MNNRIIKIESIQKYFSIQWMLGAFCNYDCMYCPTEFHDITSKPHDLKTMQTAWTNIHNKTKHLNLPYKISFTGGEVTANKNFLPLVNWLRETYTDIEVIIITTNGSASTNYYSKLIQVVEAISFSTHSEFMDEQEFFNKALTINQLMPRPMKSFHVNIMNERWNQDRIKLYQQWLERNQISYSVNAIDYSVKIREVAFQKGNQNLELN
jgi:organic radical activating enzyme